MEFYCKIKVFPPLFPQYSILFFLCVFSPDVPGELDLLTTEDGRAEFRAAVSNMKPHEVFSYRARSSNQSIRSQESPSKRLVF